MNSVRVQLPTKFQPHPENTAVLLTLEDICYLIREKKLTHEGAQLILEPSVWPYLPKPQPAQAKRSQRGGWWEWLSAWRV
jgi:hypothetical protein